MQVTFTRTAMKDLRKVPAKDRQSIIEKLQIYGETGQGDVKKLKGRTEYRLRHGNWRALFEIEGDVIVVRVAHRSEAYN